MEQEAEGLQRGLEGGGQGWYTGAHGRAPGRCWSHPTQAARSLPLSPPCPSRTRFSLKLEIPMASEYYSMLGVSLLIKTIQNLKSEANPTLSILGIIATHHKRTIHAREVVSRTKAELGEQIRVFETPINDSTRFAEAAGLGKTVFETAPEIEGAQAYRQIAKEIVYGKE